MKHYKIVNLNQLISQQGGGNLIVMSYNLSWQAMSSTNIGDFKLCVAKGLEEGICKSNIMLNITNNLKKYSPDFATFQEASEYKDIIDLFDLNIYDYHINISEKEFMLSLWNKKKFTLIKSYDGEFSKGRPFVILILENNRTHKNMALINLHAGHFINTQKTIFDIINNFIKLNIKPLIKKSIKRVIISGDFNRDIYQDETSDYVVNFSNSFQLLKSPNNKYTCCSTLGYGHKFNYDHVLDSKDLNEKKILGNSTKNYKIPSSDHILIIVKLKS